MFLPLRSAWLVPLAVPRFLPGDVVLPRVAHLPEHAGKDARVLLVVYDRPFYVLDFGDGHPHRWYAEDELMPAPRDI